MRVQFKSIHIPKNFILFLFLIFISNPNFAVNSNIYNALTNNIKNTKILNIYLNCPPHSTSNQIVFDTTSGRKKIIIKNSDLLKTLSYVKNPNIVGTNNANIANNIISNKFPKIKNLPCSRPYTLLSYPYKTFYFNSGLFNHLYKILYLNPGFVISTVVATNNQASQ